METSVTRQALALGAALAVGLGLGVLYDLLRPLRYRAGRWGAAALDGGFCLCAGFAAFLFAMGAGDGRLGTCQLGVITAGFLWYLFRLVPRLHGVKRRIFRKKAKESGTWKKFFLKTQKKGL